MKRILLAGGAIVALSATAWAMDGDKQQHTQILVGDGHQVIMNAEGQGPVVEIRGENGERTIHMERDGRDTTLRIDGQTVEIADGVVTVDGERIEAGAGSVIIVGDDDIRVVEHDFEMSFGTEFAAHMAERAEHMARMHEDFAENFVFEFDSEGLEADIIASLDEALEGLDDREMHFSGDWEDLSPEEREEVREDLREAREDIREAMREVREELRDAARNMEGERARVRVELRNAEREMARAERDMARAERQAERELARAERDAERHRRHVEIRRHRSDSDVLRERSNIRIEEDDDGRRRVWIDGEEQTGDDLVDWLNRLETDRLAGAGPDHRRRHVERLRFEDGQTHRVIEIDDGERVVILENRGGDK